MIAAHFPNRASLISFLGEKLVERRLAIFLGSGVSKELIADDKGIWSGLPTWPDLIKISTRNTGRHRRGRWTCPQRPKCSARTITTETMTHGSAR